MIISLEILRDILSLKYTQLMEVRLAVVGNYDMVEQCLDVFACTLLIRNITMTSIGVRQKNLHCFSPVTSSCKP